MPDSGVSCPCKTATYKSESGRVHFVVEIFNTVVQLVTTLGTLLFEIGTLALRHALLIAWVAWWLWGVNWNNAWRVLANGGWAVVVLLTVLAALAWAAVVPSACDCLGLFQIPNYWWQLGAVTLVVLLALLCGWLQGVFGWAPAEMELAPAAGGHPNHHEHGHP
jgi:hypothetical protein